MESGKLIVAVDVGGFKKTTTLETGILVHPDVDAIIDAITSVGTDPEKYRNACIAPWRLFGC